MIWRHPGLAGFEDMDVEVYEAKETWKDSRDCKYMRDQDSDSSMVKLGIQSSLLLDNNKGLSVQAELETSSFLIDIIYRKV